MVNVLKSLIKFINENLGERRWSARELARQSGLTGSAISAVLSGKKDIRLSTIEAIAKGLSVEPFYLLMNAEQRASWDSVHIDDSKIEARIRQLEQKLGLDEDLTGDADLAELVRRIEELDDGSPNTTKKKKA